MTHLATSAVPFRIWQECPARMPRRKVNLFPVSESEFGRLRQESQPTHRLTLRSGKGLLRPFEPQLPAPLPEQRTVGRHRPPNPVGGAPVPERRVAALVKSAEHPTCQENAAATGSVAVRVAATGYGADMDFDHGVMPCKAD